MSCFTLNDFFLNVYGNCSLFFKIRLESGHLTRSRSELLELVFLWFPGN